LGFGLLATSANACSGDVLIVENWAIEPIDKYYNELSWTVRSNLDKPIRMIDASLGFQDALGERIASLSIDRDAAIPAKGTYSDKARWGPSTFERLLHLRKSEVEPFTCVRALLYDDGTKEEFR
jgi:hypothetical protein